MTMRQMLVIAATIVLTSTAGAMAQAPDGPRFRLEETDQGLVRLDTQTGAMALCLEKDGNLVCRMAADERTAYEDELSRLEKRVTALEAAATTTASPSAPPDTPLPSDAEIDRSIGIMQRFMRSFFGMVEEFKGHDSAAPAAPDRT
ncbi:MAG: hypothetical protein ACOH2J_14525 [Allorhizobium sp.]